MLTAIQKSIGLKVFARDAVRKDGPYVCAGCGADLNLRRGSIRVAHFAHKPPVTCQYGMGETREHHEAKLGIYDGLVKYVCVKNAELEKRVNNQITDVYAEINGIPVAIEIQRSKLTVAKIRERTVAYHAQGLAVVWIMPTQPKLTKKTYSPSAMEKWLHAAYMGRVYYWVRDALIQPIHFDKVTRYIEETDFGGGYFKTYKNVKKPSLGRILSLVDDFGRCKQSPFGEGAFSTPARTLYMDQSSVWWDPRREWRMVDGLDTLVENVKD